MALVALAMTACSGSKTDTGADSTTQTTETTASASAETDAKALLNKVIGARYQREAKDGNLYEINFGPDNQMLIMLGLTSPQAIQVHYTPDFNTNDGSIEVKNIEVQQTEGISESKAAEFVATPMNFKISNDYHSLTVSKCKDDNMNGTYKLINPEGL